MLYECSRRKPGWRFTAGVELSNNGVEEVEASSVGAQTRKFEVVLNHSSKSD